MASTSWHLLPLVAALTVGTVTLSGAPAPSSGPLKVFLLAGGANMQGKGLVEKDPAAAQPPGSLRHMVGANKGQHAPLLNPRGEWVVRDDAWIWTRQGDSPPPAADQISMGELGVGFGATSDKIGPEFGFGHALADHFHETVVIIKIAWGDSSLYQDFRPPTAVSKRGGTTGPCFTRMIESYNEAMEEIKKKFPGREIQLTGFGWHQGAADRVTDLRANEYAANLEDLIKDVRSALGSPNLPVVIASSSMGETWDISTHEGANATTVENAQLAFDGQPNISVVYTRPLFYPQDRSPENDPTHWNQNGESFYTIGSYMGRKLVQMCSPVQSAAPAPPTPKPAPPTPPSAPATPPKVATTPTAPPSPQPPPSSGSAKALVYEPFDYPVGDLNGGNSGQGFKMPWTAAVETKIASGSLRYGSLPAAGNSIGGLHTKNRFGGTRQLNMDLAKPGLLADGATLWFSAIVGYQEDATTVNSYLGLALANQGFNPGPAKIYIEDEGPQRGCGLGILLGRAGRNGNTITPAHFRDLSQGVDRTAWIALPKEFPISLFSGKTRFRLAVVKFTWGADIDTIDVYAPEENLLLPRGPHSTLSVNVDQKTYDTLTWTRADRVVLDEIRFGPTYESVGGLIAK